MNYTLQNLGKILKEQRENEKLSVNALAKKLKIRNTLIESIEEGNFSNIPGRSAYILGFLKSYAKELKLDEKEITDFYKQCDETNESPVELKFPEKISDHSIAPKIIIATSIALAIIIYIIWKTTYTSPEQPLIAQNNTQHPLKEISTTKEPPSAPTTSETTENSRLILLAKENTWIKVTDNKKSLLHEITLQSGDTFFLPEKKDLIITAENSDSIEIFLDNNQQTFIGTLKEIREE